ncbi:hypothetical protein [Parabacteroides sp. ZJ-118]|uniref:hypothetical protein n=1 Tax=Parabacteroides sp. ZJ-118 TaxID=2709398 RepID=UPI0013EB045A|nr:hypothetical protein [Parabacteroides sp. ZJ-118]
METKEYFEKVMQDYNQHRKGRSLRKYCKDEGVDYAWLIEYIEDILTRLMKGEKADAPFLPNKYVPRPKQGQEKAA